MILIFHHRKKPSNEKAGTMSNSARLAYTPIAVDSWGAFPGTTLYFLTHMHADHTVGLSPSWNRGLIHCSPNS